eukprot:5501081-Prorocentrum_lima.AAC.1
MEHETSPAGCMLSWPADAVLDDGYVDAGLLVEEEEEGLAIGGGEMVTGSGDGDRCAAGAETALV